jgi:hypothetical protein
VRDAETVDQAGKILRILVEPAKASRRANYTFLYRPAKVTEGLDKPSRCRARGELGRLGAPNHPRNVVRQAIDNGSQFTLPGSQPPIASTLDHLGAGAQRPGQVPQPDRRASAYHSCGQCQGRAACTDVILEDLVEAAGKQQGVDERRLRRRGSIIEHEKQASTQLAEISEEIVRWEWSHF